MRFSFHYNLGHRTNFSQVKNVCFLQGLSKWWNPSATRSQTFWHFDHLTHSHARERAWVRACVRACVRARAHVCCTSSHAAHSTHMQNEFSRMYSIEFILYIRKSAAQAHTRLTQHTLNTHSINILARSHATHRPDDVTRPTAPSCLGPCGIYMCVHMCMCIHIRTYVYAHTHTHTQTHTHINIAYIYISRAHHAISLHLLGPASPITNNKLKMNKNISNRFTGVRPCVINN